MNTQNTITDINSSDFLGALGENWQCKWIRQAGEPCIDWRAKVLPAPFFRRVFDYKQNAQKVTVAVCGLGYYELYINDRKVGDHVLDPVVTCYDKRVRYVVYDVTEYLVAGKNVVGVILGNGWYNPHTAEVWHFDKAPWRDYPKFTLQIFIDDEIILQSDNSWKSSAGPILFDGLRNGETYDAGRELENWLSVEYDDSEWDDAVIISPPGGVMEQQTMPPCKIMETLSYVNCRNTPHGTLLYDFGVNITGWSCITVRGSAGTEILIKYAEKITEDGCLDQDNISHLILDGRIQTDCYILKGSSEEVWGPRFTYHGFRYVELSISGEAQVINIEACFVHTSFEQIGRFQCSDDILNKLQECTIRSYKSNFTGIPTDCPHREKNGWTGDALLAAETGLFNFDAAVSYEHWLDSMADIQRPSGQFPGIVPSGGWGYNWGSGPAWDSAFLLIPWYIYLYTGRINVIEKYFDKMKRYVDYCTYMADDNIVSFGLGDWCHVDEARMVTPALTSTAYYFVDTMLISRFAGLLGKADDEKSYAVLAAKIKSSFNKYFYCGNGIYGKGEQTAMGCAIYQGLVADSELEVTVQRLVEAINDNSGKPDFGILGAKYIPRALGDNGFTELGYKLITQPEFPGWVYWLRQGATTLWESWRGDYSLNHIMYGDISAWMYQYIAGIKPDADYPGFGHFVIHPVPVAGIDWVNVNYKIPAGQLDLAWNVSANKFNLNLNLPEDCGATVKLPDGKQMEIGAGETVVSCELQND